MADQAVYGLWLNQKGKVMADSFVLRLGENEFWVGSYTSPAAVIRERLEAYIIADDVTLQDETDDWGGITFFSKTPGDELVALLPGGLMFRGRRAAEAHWEWVAPRADWLALQAQLDHSVAISATAMEQRRIAAAIPAVPTDIGPGELPNEGGLDQSAVSYTKGCYLGQEVMARLKAMGQVRRQLLRVHGKVTLPKLPAALFAGGRQVGELRSAVASDDGFIGLALLTLMHLPADDGLALHAEGPALITIQR